MTMSGIVELRVRFLSEQFLDKEGGKMKKYLIVLAFAFGVTPICDADCRVNYDYRNSGGNTYTVTHYDAHEGYKGVSIYNQNTRIMTNHNTNNGYTGGTGYDCVYDNDYRSETTYVYNYDAISGYAGVSIIDSD